MSNRRCETCAHFQPDATGELLIVQMDGLCRGVPPTTTTVPVQRQSSVAGPDGKRQVSQSLIGVGFWPSVRKGDICPNWAKGKQRTVTPPQKPEDPPEEKSPIVT